MVETRREKGCLAYELSHDAKEPTRYFAYERWRDLAGLESHVRSAHFKELVAQLGDLVDGPPDVQVLLPVEP